MERVRGLLKSSTKDRIVRRRASITKLYSKIPHIRLALFVVGYLWMLLIPLPSMTHGTYIDENALQPGQVNTFWSWADVNRADTYLNQLESLRDSNASSTIRAEFLAHEFTKLGIPSSTQQYTFDTTFGKIQGANAYAIISSPRTPGTEAMIISASWLSHSDTVTGASNNGSLNLRGVSTVMALAGFLKRYSLWAKDIILIIGDGSLEGMQAWLSAYHGVSQSNLHAEKLTLSSGVIWTALNIDYPGHSFSHLGLFFEGLNGRLPNQDLLNSFTHISRYTGGVPITLYTHPSSLNSPLAHTLLPTWLPESLKQNKELQTYAYYGGNVVRHVGYQARGRASGVHGLLHQFRIDAFTMFAVPAQGPHGFHAIGRIIESTLRTTNNLLERLHASFFFYILVSPERFLKIGNYLPSTVLVSVAIMFGGLRGWVDAGWVRNAVEAGDEKEEGLCEGEWVRRRRPVLKVLGIMVSTHLVGALIFAAIQQPWLTSNHTLLSLLLLLTVGVVPYITLLLAAPHQKAATQNIAPLSMVLKSLNMCLASAVISITSLLNFSLATTLAIILGPSLSLSLSATSPSKSFTIRLASYASYVILGFGWILAEHEVREAIWNWEVLRVWFAPFVCVVYAPLVLQAAFVCALPE